jgi:hypothetical protein
MFIMVCSIVFQKWLYDMKIYMIKRIDSKIGDEFDIKHILFFNGRTKKLLESYNLKPFYFKTQLYVSCDEDIMAEILLTNDINLKFILCD